MQDNPLVKKRLLTIASEIQNLIKCCGNLISDLRMHRSNIPSNLGANDRNLIGVIVDIVSQRITSVIQLQAAFNTSQSQRNRALAHIVCGFRERKLIVWRSH